MPLKHKSNNNFTELVSLYIHRQVVKKYCVHGMLGPVIVDLKVLETEGITVSLEENTHHFKGTASYMSGDNLAAHAVGGLHENFSTVLRFCRYCRVARHEIQEKINAKQFTLWYCATFDTQARDAANDHDLRSVYGVKEPPALNELQHFHTVNGLPPDISHDFFEGIVPEVTFKVLSKLVEENILTFIDINHCFEFYPYSTVDKPNKPYIISLDSRGRSPKINCTQSQMRCLSRLLPIIIGDKIPEEKEYWSVFLHMLDMIDHASAFEFDNADIEYLNEVVETFSDKRFSAFPGENTKPNSHYILHYGQQTKKFGPLRHCWTI